MRRYPKSNDSATLWVENGVPFTKRSFDFLPPSFSRRGWGRFFGDRRTPLNPPSERGEENDATFLGSARMLCQH